MTTLIENDSKEIVKIITSTGRNILDIFTNNDALEVMLELISNELKNRWIDESELSEDKQRKVLISKARSIASVALRLDELGKEEVAKLKDLPKKVDAGRRQAKEYFDKWKEEVRRPVTEWEAEQEKVKALAQKLLDEKEAYKMHAEWLEDQEDKRLAELDRQLKLREEIKKEIKEDLQKECISNFTFDGVPINPCTLEGISKILEKPNLEDNSNNNNKSFVNKQVLNFFLANTDNLSEDDAKKLITAIIKKQFQYIKICY